VFAEIFLNSSILYLISDRLLFNKTINITKFQEMKPSNYKPDNFIGKLYVMINATGSLMKELYIWEIMKIFSKLDSCSLFILETLDMRITD
jgi:hypothetical protein